jgi:hypothetical protein
VTRFEIFDILLELPPNSYSWREAGATIEVFVYKAGS